MSRLLCCLRARRHDMGAALSHPQEGEACDGGGLPASPPTMADVIRERKKKAGGAGLGTLRRRIAAAARRPRDSRPDRGCEHARFIRSVVSSWRLAEVFLLCEELEAGAALRDLVTQAELAREPAARLHADLAQLLAERWRRARRCGTSSRRPSWPASPPRACTPTWRSCWPSGEWLPPTPSPQLEAGAALRDLVTQAELAREPAARLHADLAQLLAERWRRARRCGTSSRRPSWPASPPRACTPTWRSCWPSGEWLPPTPSPQLEAGAALRDLVTQAELAREPAARLHADLAQLLAERLWCDVEVVGAGWSLGAHRAVLAARCTYFRDLLLRYPKSSAIRLEGVAAGLRREEGEALLRVLYAGPAPPRCAHCRKWERGANSEAELDIINVENTSSYRRGCSCSRGAAAVRRLAPALGLAPDALHQDMKYLLDSGELCDARLTWRSEGAFGFRGALELPCHTLLLAARSRFFRSVMSRRAGAGGAVCVDEKVLPRRFAHALLHAAYTDQVDLSLIGRNSSPPSSATSTISSSLTRGSSSRSSTTALLDDAFQLYEIARFLEMPIAVQGCEDAIVLQLSADTLPHVLRWCSAPHASAWVRRQAMRYLRDEFPAIMSSSGAARLSSAAVGEALASPFLQASEAQALRALLRWAERAHAPPEPAPNVLRHAPHAARRARGRRRDLADRALRDALAPLAPLVRAEHLPPDCPLLHQAVRRGVLAAPAEGACSADAWLGRGAFRPPRCFLPYLDEIKALLEDQAVPEGEVALIRRARYLQRIPDTLYMVRDIAPPRGGGGQAGVHLCVAPRALGRLRARARELRATPAAARALALHHDTRPVHRQIALRAVREMSLPDACADLLLSDDEEREGVYAEGAASEASVGAGSELGGNAIDNDGRYSRTLCDVDCCRSSTGSLRCSTGSLRSTPSAHAPLDKSRSNTCRRELPARPDTTRAGRLSAAVPDVAMAPNGNTHLLTPHYPYPSHSTHPTHPTHSSHSSHSTHSSHNVTHSSYNASSSSHSTHSSHIPTHSSHLTHAHTLAAAHRISAGHDEYGGVVQLDLGDGATHTPRPGSRAQRARPYREHSQAVSCSRDDDLRVAIELSVIRAYGSLQANRRADLVPSADACALRRGASPARSDRHRNTLSVSGAGAVSGVSGVSGLSGVSGVSGVSGLSGVSGERACGSERASPAGDFADTHSASYSRARRDPSPAYTS
ncbi:uncharacterized protein LOC123704563 [Colias croceus]|uniref:uncharacterized protein LOC123704563 n=1 Tax=Colias crocea TaxID=72248 RepID=UPI001E280991|nr:uncharacterized protein LOC123704563 [Colias croceus]